MTTGSVTLRCSPTRERRDRISPALNPCAHAQGYDWTPRSQHHELRQLDRGVTLDLGAGVFAGLGVHADDEERAATGREAGERHVGDVDAVFADDSANGADHAGLIVVFDHQQLAFGGINWTPTESFALLAGSSSIYHSLRAGLAIAKLLNHPQPEWELAGGRLGHAIREHPSCFADKSTFSMDWYYPILGGAVRGQRAKDLLASRWEDFVVDGLGIRCVDTNPWVTGAETCELAMALDAIGDHERALTLLADMQHLRDAHGRYWTGWVFGEAPTHNQYWPVEHTTYTAAAVILAVDALGARFGQCTAASGIMRGDDFGQSLSELALECGCPSLDPVPSLSGRPR